jgi:hypothetical protein
LKEGNGLTPLGTGGELAQSIAGKRTFVTTCHAPSMLRL